METARELSAKSFELRAATSLTRLWQHQGRRAEVRQLLAEIYNWFTEGFDTKDLQEPKTLLNELSWNGNDNWGCRWESADRVRRWQGKLRQDEKKRPGP